jgi:hypothetical protein
MNTQHPFAGTQTPKQRKAQAALTRERVAVRRAFNTMIGFWQVCEKPLCRRRRCCSHDVDECHRRHWPLVPEDEREYLRACIKAAKHTRSPEAIHRAGIAARDAAQPAPAEILPDPRVRRL